MSAALALAILLLPAVPASDEPIEVCATTPSLGSLVRAVAGEDVSLTVFAKGTEDAHFVEPRPSFIKGLSRADLLVMNGMELEVGWLPALLQGARNARVLPGASGYLDGSTAITPLEVPVDADRSMGDVHRYGNPHYLLDPLNGLAVARLLRDRLSEIRPSRAETFDKRYAELARSVGEALVGPGLAERYDVAKLALLAEHGKLIPFLESQGEEAELGGWLGRLRSRPSMTAAADHNLWVYFARRFGVRMIGYLEPKPGVPPTTKHLRGLIETMRAQGAEVVLSAAYYNPAHVRFVAERTGARVASVAHEVGARPGTEDYLRMVDYNVRQIVGDDDGS